MPDEPTVNGMIVAALSRLEQGVTSLDTKLDTKVDKADLSELRGELKSHHDRINKLEESERAREVAERTARKAAEEAADAHSRVSARKARRTTFMLSLLGTVAMVLGALSAFGVHL